MRTLKIYFTLFVLVSAGLQVSPASALSHGCPYAAPPGAVAPGQLNPTLQHVLHWTLTACVSHRLVTGIEHDIRIRLERPATPGSKLLVQHRRTTRHLR